MSDIAREQYEKLKECQSRFFRWKEKGGETFDEHPEEYLAFQPEIKILEENREINEEPAGHLPEQE